MPPPNMASASTLIALYSCEVGWIVKIVIVCVYVCVCVCVRVCVICVYKWIVTETCINMSYLKHVPDST